MNFSMISPDECCRAESAITLKMETVRVQVVPEQFTAPRGAAGRRPAPVNLSDLKHHHNISLVAFTGTGTEEKT